MPPKSSRERPVSVSIQDNEVFVSDGYGNSRIMVYDADTGMFKRMWGAYGNKPLDMDQRPAVAPSKPNELCPMVCGICRLRRVRRSEIMISCGNENADTSTIFAHMGHNSFGLEGATAGRWSISSGLLPIRAHIRFEHPCVPRHTP